MGRARLVAKGAFEVWKRLPPKRRKQLLEVVKKHGPAVAKKYGPKVAKHVVKSRVGKKK